MSFNFQPMPSSSFDANHQLSIPHPRILPAVLADGREATEYQFAFIRNGEALGGLGLLGPDELVERDGRREWVFTLDLGAERLIRSVLDLKRTLNDTDDDFAFVRGLARGLVAALAGRTENRTHVRYRVVATREILTGAGVSVPENFCESSASGICLAEVTIMTSSQPPVPARLRELLNAYPTYLEQIEQLLREVANEPAASPRLELAIWALEGRASRLLSEAKGELKVAMQSGDPNQIAIAQQKELLMGSVVIQKPWLGDMDFTDYFRSQGCP